MKDMNRPQQGPSTYWQNSTQASSMLEDDLSRLLLCEDDLILYLKWKNEA